KGAEQLPAPKPLPGFDPNQIRMPRMGTGELLGTTPRPTAKDLEEFNRFIERVIDPRNTLDLVEGRARLVILKQALVRVQIADESIAIANNLTPKQMPVLGRRVGPTVLNLWFTDAEDMNKEKVLSYLARVIPDPEAKERVERAYKALEDEINRNFPNS